MADDNTTTQPQPPQPNPDLKGLDRLVGTWNVAGGAEGQVTYQWMDGGFFLLQHVELEQYGQQTKGIEIIGHERLFGAEPSADLTSRFYDSMGNTLDYVYELEGDVLTIWGGEKAADMPRPRPGSSRRRLDPPVRRARLVIALEDPPPPGPDPRP